jgi:hypothetical protein
MTRKGYEMIAKLIREWEMPLSQKRSLTVELAAILRADNSRFDKHKFYKACGLEDLI